MPAWLGSGEGLPPELPTAAFSLWPNMAERMTDSRRSGVSS